MFKILWRYPKGPEAAHILRQMKTDSTRPFWQGLGSTPAAHCSVEMEVPVIRALLTRVGGVR